jgi:hypothetical protein
VIEWAERWFDKAQSSEVAAGPQDCGCPSFPQLRWVKIDAASETVRRITYEDIGA